MYARMIFSPVRGKSFAGLDGSLGMAANKAPVMVLYYSRESEDSDTDSSGLTSTLE